MASKNTVSAVSSGKENTDIQSSKKVPFAVSEAYKAIRVNLISVLDKQNKKTLFFFCLPLALHYLCIKQVMNWLLDVFDD